MLDGAATLLAFGAWAAIIAETAATTLATVTATAATAATTTTTLAVTATFAAATLAAEFAALLAFGTWAAIFIAETTTAAAVATLAATTASTAMVTRTAIVFTAWRFAGRSTGARRRGFATAEQAFQPADETARFLRLGCAGRFAIRLMGARLELAFVATLTRLAIVAGLAIFRLIARVTRLTRLTRFEGTALAAFAILLAFAVFTTFAALPFRTERRAFVASRLRLIAGGGAIDARSFPAHGRTFRRLRRKNLQFRFDLGLRRACGGRGRRCRGRFLTARSIERSG